MSQSNDSVLNLDHLPELPFTQHTLGGIIKLFTADQMADHALRAIANLSLIHI